MSQLSRTLFVMTFVSLEVLLGYHLLLEALSVITCYWKPCLLSLVTGSPVLHDFWTFLTGSNITKPFRHVLCHWKVKTPCFSSCLCFRQSPVFSALLLPSFSSSTKKSAQFKPSLRVRHLQSRRRRDKWFQMSVGRVSART